MVASAQAFLGVFAMATPALHRAFTSVSSLFGTDDELGFIRKLYTLLDETNFLDRVLALVPERLVVLKVSGIKWSYLGAPKRVRRNGPAWLGP
jgi:hypothetical protein